MDYYKQIDKALRQWEDWKPCRQYTTEWICNRIAWCWKFRKITEKQKNDFCNRAIAILEIEKYY